jgi:hypothetical protein
MKAGIPHTNRDEAELEQLAEMLNHLGCPAANCQIMASQLSKRAHQLASEEGKTYPEAIAHLLRLMRQGWSAKEKGLS